MRLLLLAVFTLTLAAVPGGARADSAGPDGYQIWPHDDGSVTVWLSSASYGHRSKKDVPLLRKNVDTGEIVAITTCDNDGYVDECVPAGRYQYGLATPYSCTNVGAYYYAEATVAAPPADCTRTVAPPQPAGPVPWGDDRVLCEAHHGLFGCATGGGVMGTNLAVLLAGAALWRWRPGCRRT